MFNKKRRKGRKKRTVKEWGLGMALGSALTAIFVKARDK